MATMRTSYLLVVMALTACGKETPAPPATPPKPKTEVAIPMPAAAPVAPPASSHQDAKPEQPPK
jgi:hypothetical protein